MEVQKSFHTHLSSQFRHRLFHEEYKLANMTLEAFWLKLLASLQQHLKDKTKRIRYNQNMFNRLTILYISPLSHLTLLSQDQPMV